MPTSSLPVRLSLFAALAAVSACSAFGGSPAGPVGELYLTGVVAEVQHRATATGVLVDPPAGTACGIQATADAATTVFRRGPSGVLSAATIGAVEVGARAEVYVDGPVAESCPVQARASSLVVVEQSP